MVPVGGAIIASPSADLIDKVAKMYPGRASMSPISDLFITLLSMGESGLLGLWEERQKLFTTLTEGLNSSVARHEEQIISSPKNSISIAVTLDSLEGAGADGQSAGSLSPSFMGSMLFQRNVSGCRVVARSSKESLIAGHSFISWGSHTTDYPHSYFTVACAVGATQEDIESFSERLEKVWRKIEKSKLNQGTPEAAVVDDTVNTN
jgi:O-phospho-L-seryl-tRNASec:L-selenocysteinyl-tRNA synthase